MQMTAQITGHFEPSKASAATFFGVSERTFSRWLSTGAPAKTPDGYDLGETLLWCRQTIWRARQNGESAGDSGNGDGDESEAELRKQKLRLENRERELRVKRIEGQLVFKHSSLAEQCRQNSIIRSMIESIPERLAASIPPALRGELTERLRHDARLILKHLANEGNDNG